MKNFLHSLAAASLLASAAAEASPPTPAPVIKLHIDKQPFVIESFDLGLKGGLAEVGDAGSPAGASFGEAQLRVKFPGNSPVNQAFMDWGKQVASGTAKPRTVDAIIYPAGRGAQPETYTLSGCWQTRWAPPSPRAGPSGTATAALLCKTGKHTKPAPAVLRPGRAVLQGAGKQ